MTVRTGEATLAVKQLLNCYCLMLTAAVTGVMVTLLPLSGRIWYYQWQAGRDVKKMFLFRERNRYLNLENTRLIFITSKLFQLLSVLAMELGA